MNTLSPKLGRWSTWKTLTQMCYLETGREAAGETASGEQGEEGGVREGEREKKDSATIFSIVSLLALLVFSKDLQVTL